MEKKQHFCTQMAQKKYLNKKSRLFDKNLQRKLTALNLQARHAPFRGCRMPGGGSSRLELTALNWHLVRLAVNISQNGQKTAQNRHGQQKNRSGFWA
jgi:hypothetical protein